MKRFRNILYLFDDEPAAAPAFRRAVDLARRNGARLTVVHCLRGHERSAAWSEKLEALVAGAAADVATAIQLLDGDPAVAVIRAVLRDGHDLVMKMGVEEHGWLAHLRVTVDERLLRECPCPVWIDRPHEGATYARILAAVDPYNEHAPELEPHIMELAVALAEIENAELHIAHAWRLKGEKRMRGRVFTDAARHEVDEMVAEERAAHEQALGRLLAPYRDAAVALHVHLEKGEPQVVIPTLVEQLGVDLIVMGTVARTGIGALLMGNTAEGILAQVRCSVLAVKPTGFKSPIALED
jgi:nucleotide-binding universal stress UspA family protein